MTKTVEGRGGRGGAWVGARGQRRAFAARPASASLAHHRSLEGAPSSRLSKASASLSTTGRTRITRERHGRATMKFFIE